MMKLRSALTLLAVLASTSCTVPDEPPLRVERSFIPTEDCSVPEVGSFSTSVDLAVSGSALVGFNYSTDFQDVTLNVNGQDIAGNQRNDFILTSITKSYATDLGVTIADDEGRIYFYTDAQSGDDSFFVLDLLPNDPQALTDLASAVPPGTVGNLDVTFFLEGETSTGQNVKTREVVFPVTIYNSGFTGCAEGEALVRNGPCGSVGQAGAPLECEAI